MANNSLRILHWNCTSASKDTIDQITHLMDTKNIHIALLQETNWDDTIHTAELLAPDGYSVFHKSRQNPNRKPSVGGGVVVLVREHLRATPRSDLIPSALCESVFADIHLGDTTITVGSVHITPDATGTRSMRELITVPPLVSADTFFLCSDFNSHFPVWDPLHRRQCPRGALLAPAVDENNFVISNTDTPTNFPLNHHSRASNIDLALASSHLAAKLDTILTDELSGHHRPLIHTISSSTPPTRPKGYTPWRIRTADPAAFELACKSTFDLFVRSLTVDCPSDLDSLTDHISNSLVSVCTSSVGKHSTHRQSKPWFNRHIAKDVSQPAVIGYAFMIAQATPVTPPFASVSSPQFALQSAALGAVVVLVSAEMCLLPKCGRLSVELPARCPPLLFLL